jgi:hypothetical protein
MFDNKEYRKAKRSTGKQRNGWEREVRKDVAKFLNRKFWHA